MVVFQRLRSRTFFGDTSKPQEREMVNATRCLFPLHSRVASDAIRVWIARDWRWRNARDQAQTQQRRRMQRPAMAALVLASSFTKLAAPSICSNAATSPPRVAALSHICVGSQKVAFWPEISLEVRERGERRGVKSPCCTQSEAAASSDWEEVQEEEEVITPATFEEFVQLNLGSWRGSFTQYDMLGRILQCIQTKLSTNSYGRGELCNLYQTMNVEQPRSMIFSGDHDYVPPWAEIKIDDMPYEAFGRRQIGYFPRDKAYAVSHQTAELLDKVLRAGVIGEDDDEKEEAPAGLKLPSRRPALVSESCLYSEDGESRLRAFHVLDPRGFIDLVGIFREYNESEETSEGCSILFQDSPSERLQDILGKWSGRAVTQRSGIYGSTFREGNISTEYALTDGGAITQTITSDYGGAATVSLVGTVNGALILFEGGLQTVLLPGGISLTCPVSVGKSVGRSQSFYLEFTWMERPGHRRRLVRTFDTDGLVVSTTLATEVKQH